MRHSSRIILCYVNRWAGGATAAVLSFFLIVGTLRGQTTIWTGTTGGDDWFDAGNWDNGIPVSGATVDIGKVGFAGTASVTIDGGGTVARSTTVVIGHGPGTEGTVVIDNTIWSNGGTISVGDYSGGTGHLTIQDSSTLYSHLTVGNGTGSTGDVTMRGGSTWQYGTTGASVTVGNNGGTGTLTLSDGAQMTGAGQIGSAGQGTVALSGTGTAWSAYDIGGSLNVGIYTDGSGQLTVSDGASASLATLTVGSSTGSGSVLLTGSGSSLYVGQIGIGSGSGSTGVLTIADGASVTFANSGTPSQIVTPYTLGLAYTAGSSGTLNIGAYDLAHATAGGTLATPAISFGQGNQTPYPDPYATVGEGVINFNQTDLFTLAAQVSGPGALVQRGEGSTVLTGANTYSGTTSITDGTLLANNPAGSATGSSAVTVSGGTLGGSGTISGPVTVSDNGHLAPGDGVGALTLTGNLSLDSGAVLDFQLGIPSGVAGTDSDLLRIGSGTLLTFGGPVTLNVTALGGFGAGSYKLIDYAGATLSGFDLENSLTLGEMPLGFTYDISQVDGLISLTVAANAIPEPAACAVLAGLLVLALGCRRRFHRRSAPVAFGCCGSG